MHGSGFDDGANCVARLQREFLRGLRCDDGHQRKSAIDFDARERPFERHEPHRSSDSIARARRLVQVARDGHIFGANAGRNRARFAAIDALQLHSCDGECEQAAFAPHNLRVEDVFHAQRFRDLWIGRFAEYVLYGACLTDGAIDYDRDPIAQRDRFGAVVSYDNGWNRTGEQGAPQLLARAGARAGIERGERLIE